MSDVGDVRIAIVGPGAIGDVHAASLRRLGITPRAVVGTVADELAGFAAKHSVATTYRALDELLADDTIDGAIVATPSHLHSDQTRQLLDAGKHVLCEIPLGLTFDDAQSVAACARAAGRTAMGGYTLRYWEPHRRLQSMLDDHDIRPTQIVVRSLMLRQTNVGWTGRQRDWTDNVLWHHGGHSIDAALWHLGASDTVEVRGAVGPTWPGSGAAMDVAAVLSTEDHRFASITLSYHSRIPASDFLVITPDHSFLVTEGRLLMDGDVVYDAGTAADAQTAAIIAQDRAFAEAIVHGTTPDTSVDVLLPALNVQQTLADLSDPGPR
ncbi:Gfo/Idh/MocA family protein [Dactylosporangium sp. CA-233914]|uniref:Gfo/Idh/MocA family protein n=1 Tax=Dactylosporangium sp. CA-233914 TaxID=3239934 RepID=UPI003D8CC798